MNDKTASNSGNELILIADDDNNIRLLARRVLEHAGFRVYEVTNGTDVLPAFFELKPDGILLDVRMDGKDGFRLCEEIRSSDEGKQIPIILLTGLDDTESINRAFELGATDFITKPVDWKVLGQRVRFMIRASQSIKDILNKGVKLPTEAGTNHTHSKSSPEEDSFQTIHQLAGEIGSHMVVTMITSFVSDCQAALKRIEEMVASEDFSALPLVTFDLKSKSAYLGVKNLAVFCKKMELCCASNNVAAAKEIQQQMVEEFNQVRTSLTNEIQKLH